ncbi:MAG: AI-2E family transporter [Candidatus Izemoplasmatales bacterium]
MKKQPIKDEALNRIIKYLLIALLGLAVLFMATQFSSLWNWIFGAIKSVIVPISIAYVIALIVFPLVKYLEKKGIGPRFLSMMLVLIFSFAIIFAVFYMLVPFVSNEISSFFENDFQTIIEYFKTDLRDQFIFGKDIYDQIYNYISATDLANNLLNSIVPSILSYLGGVLLPIFTSIAIVPMLLIYYLKDYEMISDRLRSIVPPKHEKKVAELGQSLNATVGAYLRGQLLLMFAIGTVAIFIYKLIGLKYWLVFGLIVGLTNIIPYFGSIMAAIPPLVYAFVSKDINPFYILGINIVLQFTEGNVFQPLIMSKKLEMHPIIIMISILFFGSLFGTLGVVFASPIAASIRLFYRFFKDNKKEKELALETGDSS